MNYMAEIKAFYDLVQVKQLSTGQIALWHALMHINNKCAWIEWFTVPNLTLELNTGLSRSGIYKARNVLKQYGIIDFKSNGTKATSYTLNSLLNSNQDGKQESNQTNVPMQDSKQVGNQVGNQDSKQDSKQVGNTLNKLDKTKQNDTKTTSTTTETDEVLFDEEFKELAQLYQKSGFKVNGLTPDWLLNLKDRYGFEWVKNAILEAEKQGACNKAYVEKILNNWHTWGGMKLSSDNNKTDNNKSTTKVKKNKFHNFNQRTDVYTADQLEDIARRKREEYFKKAQEGGK